MTVSTPLETPPLPDAAQLRRPAAVRVGWMCAMAGALVLAGIASVAFGTRIVSVQEVVSAFTGSGDGVAQAAVLQRIPRTVMAMIVGAALALAGCALQAVTRNPLADPGILGINSGAALAVVTGIAFFGLADVQGYMVLATLGAALTAVFVYAVGSLGRGGATPLKLALAGAATTAALQSLISAVLLPRVDLVKVFQFWQVGGVGGASWERIAIVAPVLAIGALIAFSMTGGMNALALGDDTAAGLGLHVQRTRLISTVGAVILCGAAVAVAGPIGFIGLIVPHACRLLTGPDHRWLLPISALAGAVLLTTADVLGRVVARPEEIEVGIVAAVVGAPVFIWIVRRQRVREL